MLRVSIRLTCAVLAAWIVVCGDSVDAQSPVRHRVLVLEPFNREQSDH